MENSSEIQRLIEAFRQIGSKIPVWTQAQGSNLSYKDESSQKMYIKPSGFRLDQVLRFENLVELNLESLRKGMLPLFQGVSGPDAEKTYAKTINDSKIDPSNPLRPSMETGFHLALKKKFVFHFHALSAIIMGYWFEKDSQRILNFLKSATSLKIAFINYATPGLELTQLLHHHADDNILILRNHGVILNSDSPEIVREWAQIESLFCEYFSVNKNIIESSLASMMSQKMDPVPLKVFFPDFGVFLKRLSSCLKSVESFQGKLWFFDPLLIANERDMYEIWSSYWLLVNACPDIRPLTEEEVQKMTGLPTEQYRLMMKEK